MVTWYMIEWHFHLFQVAICRCYLVIWWEERCPEYALLPVMNGLYWRAYTWEILVLDSRHLQRRLSHVLSRILHDASALHAYLSELVAYGWHVVSAWNLVSRHHLLRNIIDLVSALFLFLFVPSWIRIAHVVLRLLVLTANVRTVLQGVIDARGDSWGWHALPNRRKVTVFRRINITWYRLRR